MSRRNKIYLAGGVGAVLLAAWYFYIYDIDAKEARAILAKEGKILKPTMSDEFCIKWARAVRYMFLNQFKYLNNTYSVADGTMISAKASGNAFHPTQQAAVNSSLNEKQAFFMSRGY